MYARFVKRILDFVLSLCAIIVLSPLLLVLTVVGAVKMRGNPLFIQERPGRREKIFKLIKFRTMDDQKDENGNSLPDEIRLNRYGRFLRNASLDELPQLFNILKGDMSIVGPRPLLISYLPWYSEVEKSRHDVRPGLTGLAQVNGRNLVDWDHRLALDVQYVKNITFLNDARIILMTVSKIVKRQDIVVDTSKAEPNFAEERRKAREASV